LTLPTRLHPIGSFGLTCTSGLLPALGGAPWAYALVEKQTAVRITSALIVIPFAFSVGIAPACGGSIAFIPSRFQ